MCGSVRLTAAKAQCEAQVKIVTQIWALGNSDTKRMAGAEGDDCERVDIQTDRQ